jgi:hypothetical protein
MWCSTEFVSSRYSIEASRVQKKEEPGWACEYRKENAASPASEGPEASGGIGWPFG